MRRVEVLIGLQLRVRLELGQESRVCLVEVREGNVLRRATSTGGDVDQAGGEVAVSDGTQGTGGKVIVVRDQVGLGVVAPGSLIVAGVGQLISLQPVLVVPAQAEAQRPAEVRGEVGDGGDGGDGVRAGEGSLYTPVKIITGGGVVTTQVRTPIPLPDLACPGQHGEPAFILLGAVPLKESINTVIM